MFKAIKIKEKESCYDEEDEDTNVSNVNHNSMKKPALNLNKIKNIVQNDKIETRNSDNIKIIPIEKKILLIAKKFTTKIESEIIKEFMNYKLILNKLKKSDGDVKNKINAFYYLLLNKIDKNL